VASFPNGASLHDRRGDSSPTIVASGSMLRLLHGNCHAARTTFRTSTHSCLLSWNEELGERSGIQWRNLHQSQNDRMKSGDLSKVKMEGENRKASGEGSLLLSEQITSLTKSDKVPHASQITKFPFACTDERGRSAEAAEPEQLWFCFPGLWQSPLATSCV